MCASTLHPAASAATWTASSDVDSWNSDDPSARVDPTNDGEWETTWSKSLGKGSSTYAHEFGHVIGLDDAYQDFTDPATGRVGSAPRPGAPIDLMSTGAPNISQETINRVVRRSEPLMIDTDGNSVSDSDFKCDLQLYITGAELQQTSPGGVLSYDLSIDPGGPIDLPVDKNDAFSATATVRASGPVKALICSGHYDSQEELKVTGTVSTNSNGDRVAHVKLSGPPGSGTSQVKCENAGGSFPISGGGGFSNRWTIGIGPLDLVVGDPPVPVTSDKPVSNITTHVAGEFQVLDELPPE